MSLHSLERKNDIPFDTQITESTPRLPDEVLLHVASFIPESILRRYYGVSKLFYELAMPLRYGSIDLKLSDTDDASYVRWLERLSDPLYGHFVRHLTVTLDEIRQKVPSRDTEDQLRTRRVRHYVHLIERWSTTLQSFTRVSGLTLILNKWPGPLPDYVFPLITSLWRRVGTELRYFALDTSFEKLERVLQATTALPSISLQHIKLSWRTNYGKLTPDAVTRRYSLLAALISRAQGTLETLELESMCFLHDIGHLFGDLKQIRPYPKLRRFSLLVDQKQWVSRPVQSEDSNHLRIIEHEGSVLQRALGRFIHVHSDQLVSLQLETPSEWFVRTGVVEKTGEETWRVPPLSPDLSSLRTNYFPNVTSCLSSLQDCTLNLTVLVIADLAFLPFELIRLLELLSSSRKLVEFSVYIAEGFTALLFHTVAANLPTLEHFSAILASKFNSERFRSGIAKLTNSPAFRNWALRNVEFSFVDQGNKYKVPNDSNIDLWIGQCCPRLERYNGRRLPIADQHGNYLTGSSCGGLISYGYSALSPTVPGALV